MLASFMRYCVPWGISLFVYVITALPGNAQSVDNTASNTLFGSAIPAEQLEEARGGSYFSKSEIDIVGSTENNVAKNVRTGDNVIDAASFQQMNGIPVVVQNSGANVLIQNAVIVNMHMN